VISAAIRHPGVALPVSRRQRPSRITCTSSGTTSCDGETRAHAPLSIASRRTIHRRNRFSRLHPLPHEGLGKK
jgi:hypothetical protein